MSFVSNFFGSIVKAAAGVLVALGLLHGAVATSTTSSSNTFYTTGVTNIRSCPSTNCFVIDQYPASTSLSLNYPSIDAMPEWVPVEWSYQVDGITHTGNSGYIDKAALTNGLPTCNTDNSNAPCNSSISSSPEDTAFTNDVYADNALAQLHSEGKSFDDQSLLQFMINYQNKYGSANLLDSEGNYDFEKAYALYIQPTNTVVPAPQPGVNTSQSAPSQPAAPVSTADNGSAAASLPSIVTEWSPRVVRVDCSDSEYVSTGSGVLTRMDFAKQGLTNTPTLITNEHVLTDPTTGNLYTTCNFEITGTNNIYNLDMNDVLTVTGQDVAFVTPNQALKADSIPQPAGEMTAMKVCSANEASVGDEIAILGYPVDGGKGQASTAITLTQGIISSYDGEYYVTDASIDHGNSGGAAILLKDDCYLGIPTWVESGGFASLGRILSEQYVFTQ